MIFVIVGIIFIVVIGTIGQELHDYHGMAWWKVGIIITILFGAYIGYVLLHNQINTNLL